MARVIISAQNQIERLNHIDRRLKEIELLSPKELVKRPAVDKWSIAEIVEHMQIAYSLYTDKLNETLKRANKHTDVTENFTASRWVSLLLNNFRPKNGVIKLKMKTQKIFEPKRIPAEPNETSLEIVFTEMYTALDHLKTCANEMRFKQLRNKRFSSAIGPVVRFTVPEAIEFILRHNERHMFQIERLLHADYDGYFAQKQ